VPADVSCCDESDGFAGIQAAEVHHWPIVRAYAERLGLRALINRLAPTERAFEPGLIVLGMLVDTLSGRSPLYHLESFFEGQDTEVLLGERVAASVFNDDNVGATLDLLFETGTQTIYSEVAMAALRAFEVPTDEVHFDTTSVSVYGDYLYSEAEGSPLKITHGYSKDHRPDLKQFVFSLLCTGGNIPIIGRCEDGNASDKTLNNTLLSTISQRLKRTGIQEQAFTYIADSALVTEGNLEALAEGIGFITRLPATYGECERVIRAAVAANAWSELGRIALSPPTKNRPGAHYRLWDSEVTLYGKSYRAVVVHSSAHDQRRQKRLQRELKESEQCLQSELKSLRKQTFFCQADAEAAAAKARLSRTAYHTLEVQVEERPQYARGRPKNDGTRTVKSVHYGLVVRVLEDRPALEQRRAQAGCFVLLTNLATDGERAYSAAEVLQSYKQQHGIEQNFGFLKDDAIVNAIFLKTPARIEALGLILLLALLIWRLIEQQMRQHLEMTHTTLPGWDDKPTQRPTAYMMTIKFKGLLILKRGDQRRPAHPLSQTRLAFLNALGLTPEIFTRVPGAG
jgi:transposase